MKINGDNLCSISLNSFVYIDFTALSEVIKTFSIFNSRANDVFLVTSSLPTLTQSPPCDMEGDISKVIRVLESLCRLADAAPTYSKNRMGTVKRFEEKYIDRNKRCHQNNVLLGTMLLISLSEYFLFLFTCGRC